MKGGSGCVTRIQLSVERSGPAPSPRSGPDQRSRILPLLDQPGPNIAWIKTKAGSLWTSVMGTYVTYDAQRRSASLYRRQFWTMGSISASGEQDAGSLYPTVMEDSNGNQIQISYLAGTGEFVRQHQRAGQLHLRCEH